MLAARLTIILGWAVSCTLHAEADHDATWERLLMERESAEAFAEAVEHARKAGIGEQAILEARFLFHVDRGEDAAVAALAPEFLKRRDAFEPAESGIFATVEDWLAVTEYTQAVAALQKQDIGAFKKHITEAFWFSPRQADAFAPLIERQRLMEAIKDLRVDYNIRLSPLNGGDPAPLSRFNEGARATLLRFWSPWSGDCEATMPQFIATTIELAKHQVSVISILPEQSPEIRADAVEMIRPLGPEPPGEWMIDRAREPLAGIMRVRTLPTMVLLDNAGAVLFHGHPSEPAFADAIIAVAPAMKLPAWKDHE